LETALNGTRNVAPRLGARLAVKHTTQEALGGYLKALLDQDVQNDSVLINGSQQPVTFATDLQRNFIQMPLVAGVHSPSTQPWLRTWCTTDGWSHGSVDRFGATATVHCQR